MEVQMVLGQIGENTHGVVHTVYPVQSQGMGRDFHYHVGAPCFPHPGKEALELKGLRCGALRGQHLLADHILICADQADFCTNGLLQNCLEEVGGAGLSIGPRHRYHGHAPGRMAEEVGPHHSQRPAGISHLYIRNSLCRDLLAQHGRRTGSHSLGNKGVTICGKSGHGHKQVPRPHSPGVIAYPWDLQLQICRGRKHRDSRK